MKGISILVVLTFLALASALQTKSPTYCTYLTKRANYSPNFVYAYPPFYIEPGKKETYQPLHCINPATVSETITKVCDWAAPPIVQFTMGDEYVYVERQDPTNRFDGTVVITTTQKCNHMIPSLQANHTSIPTVTIMQ